MQKTGDGVVVGVVHGRFQLFHNDHLKYVLGAAARCDYLLIGITNPDVSLTVPCAANPHRSSLEANPFSYYERMTMIRGAVLEAGLVRAAFDIVPFPINRPDLLLNYVPADGVYYMSIYDDWGWEKKAVLDDLGLQVEVWSERSLEEKGLSGTDVRALIAAGDSSWQTQIPPFVRDYLLETGLVERL